MDAHEDTGHYVKRVVLPSGKTIEVVYFKDPADEDTSLRTVPQPEQDLHLCTTCGSTLVYPLSWEEAGDDWHVSLRCPECDTCREGVFAQRTVEAFDEQLDEGTEALMTDYRRLCRANMADEVERFVAALHADAIVPEDF